MVKCVFDKTSKQYMGGARWDVPVHDPAKHVVLDLPDFPESPDALILNDAGTGTVKAKAADKTKFKEKHPKPIDGNEMLDLLVAKGVITREEATK
jgi:hypothetical protein